MMPANWKKTPMMPVIVLPLSSAMTEIPNVISSPTTDVHQSAEPTAPVRKSTPPTRIPTMINRQKIASTDCLPAGDQYTSSRCSHKANSSKARLTPTPNNAAQTFSAVPCGDRAIECYTHRAHDQNAEHLVMDVHTAETDIAQQPTRAVAAPSPTSAAANSAARC